MIKFLRIIFILISILSCKKKCLQAGQYEVPIFVNITNVPEVRLDYDTIKVTMTIPFETEDIRLPGLKVSLRDLQPSACYFTLSARPAVGGINSPPIIPYQDGYFEVITEKGKRLRYLYYDFEKGESGWNICFKLIPKIKYDGLYFLRWSKIQYKDECVQIDPVTILVNTPLSHHLIKEKLDFPLSPWVNDVFFFVY